MKRRFSLLLGLAIWAGTAFLSPAATFTVRMQALSSTNWIFNPSNIVINAGDSIVWTNAHTGAQHDSTAGRPNTGTNNGWASALLLAGSGVTFPFTFSNAGNYPYRCRFHADTGALNFHPEQTGLVQVASLNLPPVVSLTNPPTNFSIAAPASLTLQALATDDGSVSQVRFFQNGLSVGTNNSAPFSLLVTNLAAGNYTFTAVATDNTGLLGTSPPLPVFVITNAVITNLQLLTNGSAQLTVLGITGQSYVFERSSNLSGWFPFLTNLASNTLFNVLDSNGAAQSLRFYRGLQKTSP